MDDIIGWPCMEKVPLRVSSVSILTDCLLVVVFAGGDEAQDGGPWRVHGGDSGVGNDG